MYTPPVINRTAPNQRAGQWPTIANIVSPFGEPVKRSFGFWFNYLWEEARQAPNLTEGDKGEALRCLLHRAAGRWLPVPAGDGA